MTSTPFDRDALGTGRTRLVALEVSLADALLKTFADERVWRWMPAAKPAGSAEMLEWIAVWQDRRASGWGIAFAIECDGAIVGSTSLYDYQPANASAEAGWTWLQPSVWGTGVNRDAKVVLYDYAFNDLGLGRLGVRTDNLNTAAQRSLDSLGLHREGVLRRHIRRPDGTMRDSVYYSVLADEWPRLRASWLSRAG
ncbi:MAG: GNAT family protein [Candidatus Nanopelagicales bacterium]|nr:GNAT family N-acetyltransferase [Candidatus Nanopelagicales bacterium]